MTKLTFRLNCSLTGKFKNMKSANINLPTTQINSKERVDLGHFVQSGEGDCGGKNRTESLLRHPPVFRITFHCKATLYPVLSSWCLEQAKTDDKQNHSFCFLNSFALPVQFSNPVRRNKFHATVDPSGCRLYNWKDKQEVILSQSSQAAWR